MRPDTVCQKSPAPGKTRRSVLLAVPIVPALVMGQIRSASKAPSTGKTILYAAVGAELTQYDFDSKNTTLTRRSSVTLPANVQEAWLDPARGVLYVAWSNGGASYSTPSPNDRHGITAFRIDPRSGALQIHGQPASLPSRPIFTTIDIGARHIITAHNNPSSLTVHQILPDGTPGARIQQTASLDFGVYGHQVRVDPSGRTVILVTRGNGPTATKPEDPGALKIFSLKEGVLTNRLSIAPGGGFGFQVRHLDFHPSGRWAIVTLERQNQIHVYKRLSDGTLSPGPLFARSTLMPNTRPLPAQTAASIHFHPDGRFVYVANRAADTVDFQGKRVFSGGENSIAVFSINQETGEPTLIQSIDTHGFTPRTFALDSTGSILAVANQSPLAIREGDADRTVPAGISLFRVSADGKLEFSRKYDVETSPDGNLYWVGMLSLR